MLERLLNEIRSGGTLQPATLAARLNVSISMVEMMLEDLERRGLLKQIGNCNTGCHGCSLAESCSSGSSQGRLWLWKPR